MQKRASVVRNLLAAGRRALVGMVAEDVTNVAYPS